MIKKRVVVTSERDHRRLTLEMAKSGLTRKKIVENAINMYIDFKNSERLLNKVGK